MSIAGIRSIFTDENTPLYTYCGSADRACLYMRVQEIYRACLYSRVQAICSFLCLRILFILEIIFSL